MKTVVYSNHVVASADGGPAKRSLWSTNSRACNARGKHGDGWAMISREKGKWYYSWATGSENGTEGPFRSEDEATIAAKTDGFKIMNSRACNALKLEPFNSNSVRLGKSVWYKGREMIYKGKGGGKVHLVDLGGNRIDVPVFDRDLKMLADAYEYYHNDGVPMPNSRACNSVRGNTKLKNIDYWFADNGYGDDTLIRYVQSYKKNRCIDFVDRYADTAARDKFYDAMYELTGIKNRWAFNSRACNSSNQVVRKAMNAKVSMNSVDAKDKEEMAKFFKLMNDTISEISRLDMEFASYIKGLLNKAEKTQDKDLADWLQKANLEWKNLKIKGKIMR